MDIDKTIARDDIWAALALGLVAILSAWLGYQATTWSSAMSRGYADSGKFHRSAMRLENQLGQKAISDRYQFERWATKRDGLRTQPHFEGTLGQAYTDWTNQGRPTSTPLEMPSYRQAQSGVADFDGSAEDAKAEADKANGIHDQYVMLEILSTTTLFILGLSSIGRNMKTRERFLAIGSLGFLILLAFALIWPKHF